MRSTAYLGIVLGPLLVAAAALADDPAPAADSLAPMPPNPVTSAATADQDAPAATGKEGRHGRNKVSRQGETASTAQAAAAGTPTPPAPTTANAAPQTFAPPKKVCRSMDVSGSKIPKRVCATQEEWSTFSTREHEDSKDAFRRLQNQGALAPPSPGVSPAQLPP